MAVAASGQGALMVRVDPVEGEHLLAEAGAEPMVMAGRPPMKGWILVQGDSLTAPSTLQAWVDRGLRYACSLPPRT